MNEKLNLKRFIKRFALVGCLSIGFLWSELCSGADPLPAQITQELAKLRIPTEALSVVVYKLDAKRTGTLARTEILSHNSQIPRNPASLMKLVTTSASLDLLGPAFTWTTQVYLGGPVVDGVLMGNVYIKGQGDPKLGVERLWLLMRRIKGLGIQSIQGDIVLDRQSFENISSDPGEFDGEPNRPYNAGPDALLINFKSLLINFVPDPQGKVARIHVEPSLSGLKVQSSVPLVLGDCTDYRAALRAEFQDPNQITFKGQYALSCGERLWPIAYSDPAHFSVKAVDAMWRELGEALSGQVREGTTPIGLKPMFGVESAQLAEIVRDINKYSNNVMAQQLFLTLGAQLSNSGTTDNARNILNQWWLQKIGSPLPKFDNGSGLSRDTLMSAQDIAKLLTWVYAQPIYPEMAASLPLSGIDGTLKQSKTKTRGHIKTGSLKGVIGIAGYILNSEGQDCAVVAIINHPMAYSARPVFDVLLDWVGAQK